jgi:hypothetical protein
LTNLISFYVNSEKKVPVICPSSCRKNKNGEKIKFSKCLTLQLTIPHREKFQQMEKKHEFGGTKFFIS